MSTHTLRASPDTVHWGYFDGTLKPCLTVDSGDTVNIDTLSGAAVQMPTDSATIPPELHHIHAKVERKLATGHICTGPIAVRGAKPGMVLQVNIDAIDLRYEWGYNVIHPLEGVLYEEEFAPRLTHIPLDIEQRVGTLPSGMKIPLNPFFGVLAVAPPVDWGIISSIPPRRNGGNLDNKELTAGSVLYLPIFIENAHFSLGDGHAAQGDGEVCGSAIETGLKGRIRLSVRKDFKIDWPMAETPTHLITMAFDVDLDRCAVIATRQMVELVCRLTGVDRADAYILCSLAADLRITQVVNGNKGIHVMLPKNCIGL